MIKNVHLIKIMKDFKQLAIDSSNCWLNKYVEKLIAFIIFETTKAKFKTANARFETASARFETASARRRNQISHDDLIAEDESNNATMIDVAALDLISSLLNTLSSKNDSVSTLASTSRAIETSRIKRKRQNSILKNNDSFLRSRSIVLRYKIWLKSNWQSIRTWEDQNEKQSFEVKSSKNRIYISTNRTANAQHQTKKWNNEKNLKSNVFD